MYVYIFICIYIHIHIYIYAQSPGTLGTFFSLLNGLTFPIPSHGPMGWLRCVGSIKLYVSFAKEPYKRDNILQKRPII